MHLYRYISKYYINNLRVIPSRAEPICNMRENIILYYFPNGITCYICLYVSSLDMAIAWGKTIIINLLRIFIVFLLPQTGAESGWDLLGTKYHA